MSRKLVNVPNYYYVLTILLSLFDDDKTQKKFN